MELRTFRKTRLATSLSLVLGVGSIMPAYAADTDKKEENIEVIQVTGIRGSLVRSMDVKRGSEGIVDAINAEDIGKFPDSNLAESLQRISGVSIDRQNGEGSRVSVRGFSAVKRTSNARHHRLSFIRLCQHSVRSHQCGWSGENR